MAACTVGPDYAGPPNLASASDEGEFVRAADGFAAGEPRLAKWWEVLGDPVLNRLEEQALAQNPDLAIAQARLDEAAAALGESKAGSYPVISGNTMAAHVRVPGIDLGNSADTGSSSSGDTTSQTIYNLGLNASWEIDLFGGHQRQVEAARANRAAATASLADAQVGLTSAVAQTYINLRALRETLGMAEQVEADRAAMLTLARQLYDEGAAPQGEVEKAERAFEQAGRDTRQLRGDAEVLLNALAVLTGVAPGAVDDIAIGNAPPPLPPAEVAIGDPADLLLRRPDIRAAERQYAAATAQIGVARAAGLPRLSFLGILGIGGTKFSDLTALDDFLAIGAPRLQWSMFDFGRNRAQVAQAEARSDGAEATYRKTVLTALQEVEDALTRFRYRREDVAALARIESSTAREVELARQRFEEGAASRLELLEAAIAHAQARQALAQGRAGLTLDFIAVEDALGLGWSGAPAPLAAR